METPPNTQNRQPAAAKDDIEIFVGDLFTGCEVAYVHVRSVTNNCIQ